MRQLCAAIGVTAVMAAGCATAGGGASDPDGGAADAGPGGADARPSPDSGQDPPDAETGTARRIVILMIGDGMGPGQLAAASHYRHGQPGMLDMQALPVHGHISTASLSGITDSAAAATTMATGAVTYNARIGLDRAGAPAETLVEAAHRLGLTAGVVTTASLPHATPGAFTAHEMSRNDYLAIADDQATGTRPDVMLGGGMQYYAPAGAGSLRDDGGLIAPLEADGYRLATTASELAAIAPAAGTRVVGLFAPDHMTYTVDRDAANPEPTLTAMSLAALDLLDTDGDGFFLVIEGARIDMASHGNDALRAITETLAFDDAVAAVSAWAAGRDDVTLVVTADHECGGLEVVTGYGPGQLPDVAWRWGNHTNARVDVFASGPGSAAFDGEVRDFTWVHEVLAAGLDGRAVAPPPVVIRPDGNTGDLRYLAASQSATTGFGAGFNQLDALRLDADAGGLAIGVEGVFEWDANAVVVLLDVDGGGAGHANLAGALADTAGRVDGILSSLELEAPTGGAFAADFALTVFGGADPHVEDLVDDAGLRGLVAPVGTPANLGWYGAAINFEDGVRARGSAATATTGRGLETYVPWSTLYPGLGGGVPANAAVAIAVVLVNDDGGFTSNQALPPFPAGTANPGRTPTALPGVVRFVVDSDGDGVADGNQPPL